jgi:hypothetical protein
MANQRISFDMDENEYKYLKMCCAKMGVKLKDFITKATINSVYEQEDKWFLETDEKQIFDTTQEFIPFEQVLKELEICV